MIKRLLLSAFPLLCVLFTFSQVTTGVITGSVKDPKAQTLPGATVKVTHLPTGTVYTTTTKANGEFTIAGLRVGGPYRVNVHYVGHQETTYDNLTVSLGDALVVNAVLEITGQTLGEVQVTGKKGGVISSQRTGASTNVSLRQLQALPTLSRSVQDFARLTPQAVAYNSTSDGSPAGITFAGQNNRYNQFTVDGAAANDVFGLAASGTNGGQAGINPVPFESVQEVQVLLSPYDVSQGGYTGGGINAVTKSGTNDFHGSAYATLQSQDLVGKSVTTNQKYATFKNNTYGASLGGALVKNKAFFFVNAERFDNSTPLAFDPSQSGSGSKFDMTTLTNLYNFLKTTYPSYDPGSYTGINKKQYSTSIFARIDVNLDAKNKLTIRHSYVDGSNYIISRTPTSMTFANSGYYIKTRTNSSVIELNSNFSSNASNVLRVTYNAIRDHRETSPFPNVLITQNGLTYNFGADFSSLANSLNQDNFTLTDNFTLYRNGHVITIGTDNAFFNTNNVFLQAYNGAYSYNKSTAGYDNIGAFENNNVAPNAYTLNYSPTNPGSKAPAIIHAAQFSLYGGDIWSVTKEFKLTYGLRIDLPVFFNKPVNNAAFNSDPYFAGYNNTKVPKATPLFAPRVGFNWNINGTGQTQLRGGLGLFTGRAPFVWISNQYGTNGVSTIKYTTVPGGLRFNYDPKALLSGAYIPSGNTPPPTEVDLTDPKFKMPQILRGNLAVDQKLPWWGLIGTVEVIYSKKINEINYKNINISNANGVVNIGSSTRPWYNFSRPDANFTDVPVLTNTSKGYAYNFTAQIQKPYSNGWTGSIAYTYGASYSLNDGTSSVAMSNWRYAYNVNGLNNLDQARSNYDPGSRIIGYISKTFKYANDRLATTIGLVYTGQSGQPFSYTYTKNISGDDVSGKTSNNNADLIYVPSASELSDPNGYTKYTIVDLTTTANGVTTVTRTAAQEWADFQSFINNNPKLKNNMGKVIARNGDRTPWESHFDLKVAEDFYFYKQHKIQIAIDILNVSNLLNKNWGWSYGTSNQDVSPLTVVSQTVNPTFTFDQTKMNLIKNTYRPYFVNDLLSRWRGQLSVRYSF
jgi:hypothetical protein